MMSVCLQIQKKKSPLWKSRDAIFNAERCVTVVLGQTAQWYASQREWYLISPSPNRGRSWQTNGFAVSRMFSRGAGWAEIQRRCLCAGASAEHNKTLWGMNQTQSDRDTKAHMLIHSVNFTISQPPPLPLFFQPTYLSLLLPYKLTTLLLPCLACHYMCFYPAGLLSLFFF